MPSPQSINADDPKRGRLFLAGFALLLIAPIALYAPALVRGEIPYFMDPVMYFFPLRWHAADLIHSGEAPFWNRCILGGMPLFSNPQAALAYPMNWLMLALPSGFSFTFPYVFQLGLWAALTALAVRAITHSPWAGLYAGALCLAGNYGWTRLQSGNYMNVLPWWPLWLLAAHRFVETRSYRRLAAGAVAAAMAILAGAHQLAFYGAVGLAIYVVVMIATGRGERRAWIEFAAASALVGVMAGATGWLPQYAFLQETARAESLDPARALAGSFENLEQLLWTLTGRLEFSRDPSSTAMIGGFALVIACFVPGDRARLRVWLGLWAGTLFALFATWRPFAEILARFTSAAVFHDPRRWLGVTNWMLIAASAVSFSSIAAADGISRRRFGLNAVPSFVVAALVWFASKDDLAFIWNAPVFGALVSIMTALVLANPSARVQRLERVIYAVTAVIAIAMLGSATIKTTSIYQLVEAKRLTQPRDETLLLKNVELQPGERFFSLDWDRASSYNYSRSDLTDWMLPNLAMIYGIEDIGGYEPARTPRYERWLALVNGWPGGRQPWREHFGLLYPLHPLNNSATLNLAEANLQAALLPRWGMPCLYEEIRNPIRRHPKLGDTRPYFYVPFYNVFWPSSFPIEGDFWTVHAEDSFDPEELEYRTFENSVLGGTLKSTLPSNRDNLKEASVMRPAEFGMKPEGDSRMLYVDRSKWGARNVDEIIASFHDKAWPFGFFVWSDKLQEVFNPIAESELAMVTRYSGPARWTQLLSLANPWQTAEGEVSPTSITANELQLTANTDAPAILEIHDAYFRGWTARVNNQPADVRPSGPDGQGLWRWVAIPPGESTVTLRYWPPLLTPALILTALGWLAITILMFRKPSPMSPKDGVESPAQNHDDASGVSS